jgi:serine-type D-Ala-D-Ala carboxypeptidase/endopeptidase
MKATTTLIKTVLISFSFLVKVNAQDKQIPYPKKYEESINFFVDGYNKQDFSIVKKSFTFLAKKLAPEKAIMGEELTPRFQDGGKITLGPPKFPRENQVLFPLVYEKDFPVVEYLILTFNDNGKVESFRFTTNNIIHKPLSASSTVDSIVTPYIKDEFNLHTGLIIGVIKNGKKSIYSYGETTVGNNTKPDESSIYQIGSITKTFTGLLLSNAFNNGGIDSVKVLSEQFPKLIPSLNYKGTEINAIHLATHTSALPAEPSNLKPLVTDIRNPFGNYRETDLLTYLNTEKLAYKPGTQYAYSNTGMGLLGYLLTQKNKTTYAEILKNNITDKLGMSDTRIELSAEQLKRKVTSYSNNKMVSDLTFQSPFVGAGGIYSTLNNMFIYLEANLSPEKTPLLKDIRLSHYPRKIDKYTTMGLGWEIKSYKVKDEELLVYQHAGNTAGTSTFIMFSLTKKIGVVVLANSSTPVESIATRVFTLANRDNY